MPISAWHRLQVTNFRFRVHPPIPGGARQSACSSDDRRACTHSIGVGSSFGGGGSNRGGRTAGHTEHLISDGQATKVPRSWSDAGVATGRSEKFPMSCGGAGGVGARSAIPAVAPTPLPAACGRGRVTATRGACLSCGPAIPRPPTVRATIDRKTTARKKSDPKT